MTRSGDVDREEGHVLALGKEALRAAENLLRSAENLLCTVERRLR
ncbi:hypothetical protein ACGFWI_05470 [Streptomyces sp. NPDC048434]